MSAPDDFLARLAATVAAAVRARLPQLRACDPMAGAFSLEELRKRTLVAPAVRVTYLGAEFRDALDGPLHRWDGSMAAYAIARNRGGLHRDEAAAAIAQAIMGLVPESDWGLAHAGPAEKASMRCLVGTAERDVAVSLWAVRWTQPFVLDGAPAPEPVTPAVYVGENPFGESEVFSPAEEAGR